MAMKPFDAITYTVELQAMAVERIRCVIVEELAFVSLGDSPLTVCDSICEERNCAEVRIELTRRVMNSFIDDLAAAAAAEVRERYRG